MATQTCVDCDSLGDACHPMNALCFCSKPMKKGYRLVEWFLKCEIF
jgi:hypothetical protein